MALTIDHKETKFGVGDTVKVHQKIVESGKTRTQIFEGMVIGIKGREENKTFVVRRIGAAKIGIEQIFPISSPSIERVEVTRHGLRGAVQAKLYYVRKKANREIERIYSRATARTTSPKSPTKK